MAGRDASCGELCHYVGHLDGVKAHLTAAENLGFWARYLGGPATRAQRERGRGGAGAFGLAALADIPGGYLSAGQKRRLALARLGVAERPMWLLDEPTVSLDAASVGGCWSAAIDAHLAGGGLAVIATHVPMALSRARDPPWCARPRRRRDERRSSRSLKRDLRLAVRQGGALGMALGFYMIVVTLLPLGLGADLNLLSRIAPGVLWIALLLAALLSLGRVFSTDYEDGSLDVLATGPLPLELVVDRQGARALDLDRHSAGAAGAGARPAAQPRDRRLPAPGRHHAGRARRPSASSAPSGRR